MSNVMQFPSKPALTRIEQKLAEIEAVVRPGLVAVGMTAPAIDEAFDFFRESMGRAWPTDSEVAGDVIQRLQEELMGRCAMIAARGIK